VWREGEPKRGGRAFHDEHEAFLAVARRASEVVVKLVVTPASTDAELEEAWRRIAATHPTACVILQPVTPSGGVRERVPAERMLALERRASEGLADVRVIPQTHPIWGAR
jgi:organic radical activating enzyme